jgi:predicted DNA-binding protein
MNNKKSHITSLRLPIELHQWIERYAAKNGIPCSFIYRLAINQYALSKDPARGNRNDI